MIQKRAYKDGHMVEDWVNYIRSRRCTGPYSFYVFDGSYMIRDFHKYNGNDDATRENSPFPSSSHTSSIMMEWGIDRKDEIRWRQKTCQHS